MGVTRVGLWTVQTYFNGGTYTAATGTWTGSATAFNALTFHAGEDGTQNLTITASTTGAEAGSTPESYTLTVNPISENPIFSGAVATSANEEDIRRAHVCTPATPKAHIPAITCTITGLQNDPTDFNGRSFFFVMIRRPPRPTLFPSPTLFRSEDGPQTLTITASTTGAEAGSTPESYTLTVNPISENPIFSGAVATSANEE